VVPTSIASQALPAVAAVTAVVVAVVFAVALAARNLVVVTGTSVPVFYNIQ
jgi:hypothetical protein